MAKRNIEEQVANLARLRNSPITEATLTALRKGLGDRVNLIIAKAAQITAELRLKALIPDLVSTFPRLLKNPGETDPQCWGKNAIAKALTDLDYDDSTVFLPGSRYVQMEAVWGGRTDTAVTLRSLCTLALVQCADLPRANKFRHLIASATDVEETVRIDALRAIEQMEGEEAALLLRLKASGGDLRAAVVGQALESLLKLEGIRALDFARTFLVEKDTQTPKELRSTADEVVEEAALALGNSRLPAAVDALKEVWTQQPKIIFLQAISTSRQESGFEFLFHLVATARERDAANALEVLSLHADSPEIRAAALAAVTTRASADLRDKYQAKFGAS